MDQVSGFIRENSSLINTLLFLGVILAIIYTVWTYLYPAQDGTYTSFLQGDADAMHPVKMSGQVPDLHTGGDFTLSFWIYIDDFNYKASQSKHLFHIASDGSSKYPLVGVLTPLTNGLMVRANTVKSSAVPAPGSMPSTTGAAGPDITEAANLDALLKQQTSNTMFTTGLDEPCDIKEVPLQRWVCITIVSSGRVLDVYMDGKLTRSCVLDNIVNVPRGPLRLIMGDHGGFGGRVASVQMWGAQLTPDVIYGIYQMGPTQTRRDIFTDIAKLLNINVSFTGPGANTNANTNAIPILKDQSLSDINLASLCAKL